LVAVLPSRTSDVVAEIKDSFGEGEVDMTHCIYREDYKEAVSSYIIRSTSTDSRTIINYNALPEMTLEEFVQRAANFGGEGPWYHFEVGQQSLLFHATHPI
jgi:ketohexokinase